MSFNLNGKMLETLLQEDRALVRKSERKGIHERREHRWEEKNKINFQEIARKAVLVISLRIERSSGSL
jgi:hypothetical protein